MRYRRPSPSTLIALVALFFALGGSAVAASRYLITSTSQIKPSVLKTIRGAPGRLLVVRGPLVTIQPSSVGVSEANCPSGYDIVSGGYSAVLGVGGDVNQNEPVSAYSWWAGVSTRLSSERATVGAVALCAPAGQAVTASLRDRAIHVTAARAHQ
jgi:hypothetical protein